VCLGAGAEHGQSTGGYYKCNKYKESKEVGGDKAKVSIIMKARWHPSTLHYCAPMAPLIRCQRHVAAG